MLAFPHFTAKGIEAHILPCITHNYLILFGKWCDAGCKEVYNEHRFNITRKGNSILKGWGYHQTGLWLLPLHNQRTGKQNIRVEPTKQENNVVQKTNLPELIKYLQAAAFSTVQSTWITATRKLYFQSCPGLTSEEVQTYLPNNQAKNGAFRSN